MQRTFFSPYERCHGSVLSVSDEGYLYLYIHLIMQTATSVLLLELPRTYCMFDASEEGDGEASSPLMRWEATPCTTTFVQPGVHHEPIVQISWLSEL